MSQGDDRPPANKTVFRPSPLAAAAGATPVPSPAAAAAPPLPPSAPPRALGRDDDVPPLLTPARPRNPVMAVAARLLTLAAAVQAERRVADPAELLRVGSAEAKAFEKELAALGLSAEDNARARYAVLATLDDIVQNLPGGQGSDWARNSLVVQSFGQAFGGDQFWTILDDMLGRPAAYPNLLELYHACLAVGFQGRLRVSPNAGVEVAERLRAIGAAIDGIPKRPETDLVPRWQGVPTPVHKVGWLPRFALLAAAVAAGLLLLFVALKLYVDAHDGPAWAALRRVPPLAPATIDRAGDTVPATESTQLTRIRGRLHSPCIQADDDGASIRLVIAACPGLPQGMFNKGAAELAPAYRDLVAEAARALVPEPGRITVAAHTDSDPISGALRISYPDNMALSKARATDAARDLRGLVDPARLDVVGRGDREPVDRGDDAAAKARDRRVELIVPRSGS